MLISNYILIKFIEKTDIFNANFYISNYEDVRKSDVDPLKHFLTSGWREGRKPSESFDTAWYAKHYSDVSKHDMNPLVHFIKFGRNEGRAKNEKEFWEQERNGMHKYQPTPLNIEYKEHVTKGNSSHYHNRNNKDIHLPLVSIICRTYNHETFIEKALIGFLGQRTNFPYEILIGDDNSSDKTISIIENYKTKFPETIRLFTSKTNKGPAKNLINLSKYILGKYVALCDGDDFWTDPLKLQIQVDFLENNKEYSLCFNKVAVQQHHYNDDSFFPNDIPNTTTVDELIKNNYIQSNSVLYRWKFPNGLNQKNFNSEAMPADWHLHLLHAKTGKIKYIDRVMGVYNKQSNGIWQNSKQDIGIHLEYGIKEVNLFKSLNNTFKQKYSTLLNNKILYIYRLLATNYIFNEEYNALRELYLAHPDINDELQCNFGLNIIGCEQMQANEIQEMVKDQISVSVIITSYNHEDYIEECVRSVISQKGAFSIEIIIGDDCSIDGTLSILQRLHEEYPQIIRILPTDKNIGVKQNMQRCFKECSGQYIAICEGDDFWLSDRKISKQLEFLWLNPECSMCFNWLLLQREDGSFLPHPQQSKINTQSITFDELTQEPLIGNFSCCLYRTEAVRLIPEEYYDVSEAYDWMFNLCIARLGNIGFLKELLSVYRIHNNGLWSKKSNTSIKAKICASKQKLSSFFHTNHWDHAKNSNQIPFDLLHSSVEYSGNHIITIDNYYSIGDRVSISGELLINSTDEITSDIGIFLKNTDEKVGSDHYRTYKENIKNNKITGDFKHQIRTNIARFFFCDDIPNQSTCYLIRFFLKVSENNFFIETNLRLYRSLNSWILKGIYKND